MGNQLIPTGAYAEARALWRNTHQTRDNPATTDIEPEIAVAATVHMFDRQGLTIPLTGLTTFDIAVLLDASTAMADMSGWILADITRHIVSLYKCDGVKAFRTANPTEYTELQKRASVSLNTLANACTTAIKWPRATRRPSLAYTKHQALNPLSPQERLVWAERAESEGWSVQETRYKVRQHLHGETPEDMQRWETEASRLNNWQRTFGIEIERTGKTVTLGNGPDALVFAAVILPNGLPGIEIGQ